MNSTPLNNHISNNINDQAFIKKLTDVAIITMLALVIPLLSYVIFFSPAHQYYPPLTVWSNYILLGTLVILTPFFNHISHSIKRGLFFSILLFFGAKSLYYGNLEFTYTIYVVLVTYTILTSNVKSSIIIVSLALLIYLSFPVLSYFKLITFYQDPVVYHTNNKMIVLRTLESLLGIGFMSATIFYVFRFNRKNLLLLQKKVSELDILNKSLLNEIADRKKAEIQADEYAHRFKTLYNNSYDGYIVLSADFTIKDVNESLLKISGYEKDEVIGLSPIQFIDPKYQEAIFHRRDSVVKGENLPDLIFDSTNKTGERLVIQSQMVDISKDQNHQYLVIVKDVTEKTIANEILARNEKLYRIIFEETSDAIILMNGSEVVQFNREATVFYPELKLGNFNNFPYCNTKNIPNEIKDSINLDEKINLTLNNKPQVFEWFHTAKNSTPTYTLVNMKGIKELGKNFYTIVEKNITDRKRNQNMVLNSVIQTEENERKRISSDLHDGIGPILTTIKLYAQALVDAPNVDKQQIIKEKLIGTVEEAVNSISEISFNISPHILVNHGILAAVEAFIEKFNLREEFDISFTHNNVSRFDENKEITIYRLFTELINNTLKHAQANKIEFKIFEHETDVELYYMDNGIGFNTQDISSKSLRMGLANFKNRIQSFNGQFTIKSEYNNGVEVFIKLPKNENL